MDHFEYRDGNLYCDRVLASDLVEEFGTPLYVYCERTIEHHLKVLREAFAQAEQEVLICYSVKANSNLSILRSIARNGAGFDVVSGGELARIQEIAKSTDKPELLQRTVYAGVGKQTYEIEAALKAGILLFNVEAVSEFYRIQECADRLGCKGQVALRVNPDVDPQTHKYITTGKKENKFGMSLGQAMDLMVESQDSESISVKGLHIHIGSQITQTRPYVEAIRAVVAAYQQSNLSTQQIEYLDIGGGFGVHYQEQDALSASEFANAILPEIKGLGWRLVLEPGRFVVANAGALFTRVVTLKESPERNFVICDAGMNDLMRPALYQSYHRIWPLQARTPQNEDFLEDSKEEPGELSEDRKNKLCDIVGPICETGDFLGLSRRLPELQEGDCLAVFGAGAYGMTMASNYNTRVRPAEVMVCGDHVELIRRRESLQDLLRAEIEI